MSSEVKLENINSLIEQEDKNDDEQSTSKMLNQSSNDKYDKSSETGQPSNSINNVQKSKDKTDKEITNLTSIILNEKEPSNSIMQKNNKPPPIDISETSSLTGNGPKTPLTPGPLNQLNASGRRKKDKDRKIGHRRVDETGQVTYKKIETSQICASIQLGIGYAIASLASKPERDLLMQDFAVLEITNFPSSGSNITPAHHFSDFKFKTYSPVAFRYFRDLFGIRPDDFLVSVVQEPMIELSNPGASGSVFYLTIDDEFILKTVQHKEAEFLQKLLPGYYMNLNQNPRTLLPKFYGLYCYICGGKNVRVCVMNNLLPSSIKMHQKYDLKGSTYKRKANKHEQKKASPTYKDLDFMEHHPDGLFLEAETYTALMKTINRDCRVLESFKIMDYSLLVGIYNLDLAAKEKQEKFKEKSMESIEEEDQIDNESANLNEPNRCSTSATTANRKRIDLSRSKSINKQRLAAYSTAMEAIHAEVEPIDEEDDVPPGGIPARNSKGERLLIYLGIIDILQSYRLKKKLEHTWKSMFSDGDTISVHKPGFYAQRFQDFMGNKVFKKIPSPLKHSPSKKKSSGQKFLTKQQLSNDSQQPSLTSSSAVPNNKGNSNQTTDENQQQPKENSSSTNQTSLNKSILKKSTTSIEKEPISNHLSISTPIADRKQHQNSPITPRHQTRDLSKSPASRKLNSLKQTELVWFSESNSSISTSSLASSSLLKGQNSTPAHSSMKSANEGAISSDNEMT